MRRVVRIVAIGGAILAAAIQAQAQPHQLVALSGVTTAPDTGGTFINGFANAAVGPNGHVVFTGASSSGTTGLFAASPSGGLSSVVLSTTVMPGTLNALSSGMPFEIAPVDANGRTTVRLQYGNGGNAGFGIFTNVNGSLQAVALTNPGTTVPGTSAPFTGFGASTERPVMTPTGQLAFYGSFPYGQITGSGVFGYANSTLTRIVANGDIFGGRVFDGVIYAPTVNASGRTAFTASHSSGVPPGSNSVFTATSAGILTEVARVNTAIPGQSQVAFHDFNPVSLNDAGQVTFHASVHYTPSYFGSGGQGLFTGTAGSLRTVAHTTVTNAAGTPVISGTVAPRVGTVFTGFGVDVAINAAGSVVFGGAYTGGNGLGLFISSGAGDLRALAIVGDALPGGGTATTIDTDRFSVNASGQVLFAASVSTGGTGVYLIESDGTTLRGVATPGVEWDVDGLPGGESRTVQSSSLGFQSSGGEDGMGRSLNDAGQVSLVINFTDNTSGVYVVDMSPVPEPVGLLAVGLAFVALLLARR